MTQTTTKAASKNGNAPAIDESTAQVAIDRIQSLTMSVPILGVTPLLVNRFSEKAKRQLLNAAQGKQTPKVPKDPEAEFKACLYEIEDGVYGFPADAFKQATVGAARFYGKAVSMTGLKQFVFMHGVPSADRALVPIEGEPTMREDVVRVGRGGTELRYRPSFFPWRCDLKVTFFSSVITQESVLSLIDAGGLAVGIGDWRPERDGTFGTFQVDPDRAVTVVD